MVNKWGDLERSSICEPEFGACHALAVNLHFTGRSLHIFHINRLEGGRNLHNYEEDGYELLVPVIVLIEHRQTTQAPGPESMSNLRV